jgi:menaquinone-9 beta-reductase
MQQNTSYDCAIIGGGLAGLTLAIQLAQANKKVVLFEKEAYPFHKVCGEYIAMESWDFLVRMGVDLSGLNLPRITKLRVSAPDGELLEQELEPGGFGISRFTLDKILVDNAIQLGVQVYTSCKVDAVSFDSTLFTIQSAAHTVRSKLVAGAFGKRSNMDVKLERNFIKNTTEYVAVKYHLSADLPEDTIELHNFKDGYCGISKVDGNRYCLCYLTSSKNLKENQNSIDEMQRKVLMQNPFLKKYLSNITSLYEKPLVISQVNFSQKEAVKDHILMIGDSAGLITPLCGNGMSMALNASKICFGYMLRFLNEEISRSQLEDLYTNEWKKTFGKRVFAGRTIQRFFGNKTLTQVFIRGLKPFPTLVKKLISLTHGETF